MVAACEVVAESLRSNVGALRVHSQTPLGSYGCGRAAGAQNNILDSLLLLLQSSL